MTKKAWIIFSAMIVLGLAGAVYLSRNNQIDVSGIDSSKAQSASVENGNIGDHTYGNMNSKVIMVEYGDYQCPGCGSAYTIIKQLTEKYKDKMGYIFRNYPLYNAHPNAFAASAAAEAAGLQGKYWEMHDKLYSNQSSWNSLVGAERTNYFVATANSLGIDGEKLSSLLDSKDIKQKIEFDTALGKSDKVAGTPSFYINGKNVGDQDVKDGKILIPSDNDSSTPTVWSDANLFDTLVLQPALKDAGIQL